MKSAELLICVMQFLQLKISRIILVIRSRNIPVWTTLKRAFSAIKVYRTVTYLIVFTMLLENTEITRANILQCLKELKYRKHYKNAHYIYYNLTGKMIDDIGYLEHKLIWDCREFIVAYSDLHPDRKKLSQCTVCRISFTSEV